MRALEQEEIRSGEVEKAIKELKREVIRSGWNKCRDAKWWRKSRGGVDGANLPHMYECGKSARGLEKVGSCTNI